MARPNYTDPTCVEPIMVGVCSICGCIDERPDALCHGYPGREPSEGHEQIEMTPVEIMPRRWALSSDEARGMLALARHVGVPLEVQAAARRAEIVLNRLAAGGDLSRRVLEAVAAESPAAAEFTRISAAAGIESTNDLSCELGALVDEGELVYVGGHRWVVAGSRREETITVRPGFEFGDRVQGTLSSGAVVTGVVASIEVRAITRGEESMAERTSVTYGVVVRSSRATPEGFEGPAAGSEVRLGEDQLAPTDW